jgi:hypothetical protein
VNAPLAAPETERLASGRRAILLTLLLMLVLCGAAVLMWWQAERAQQELQRQTALRAEQRAQQLSSVVEVQMRTLIGNFDIALLQLRREWRGDPLAFDPVVRSLVAVLPEGSVSHVTVVDRAGEVVYDSQAPAERLNLADREHFQAHRQRADDRLHVGKAEPSGPARDRWTVVVNRPLLRDGRFAGTMNIAVPTEFFMGQMRALPLGDQTVVSLLHGGGSFIMRTRDHARAMGRQLPADRPFLRDRAMNQGRFRATGEVDGVTRLYAWTRLPQLGLIVAVGLAEDEALAPVAAGRGRERGVFVVLLALLLAAGITVAWLQWKAAARQLALERSERRYRVLIDTSPEAVFLVREGQIGRASCRERVS